MTCASAPEPTRGTTAQEVAARADTAQEDTATQVTVQLEGQLSINDVLLELGEAPVVAPYPDANAGDTNFF